MAIGEQIYRYFISPVNLMGVGCHKETGKQVVALGGKKPLIVTTKDLLGTGRVDDIKNIVEAEKGVKAVIFDGVVPNPRDTNVVDGMKSYENYRY